MIRQIFYPGLLAGLIAGVFLFGAQQARLAPMIIEAETYEDAGAGAALGVPHNHEGDAHVSDGTPVAGDDAGWAPEDGFERAAYSLLANLLTAIGFGLVLAGAMALSRREVSWREGIIWGLAGYAAIHLAPALGLPPELPGMAGEGDLVVRQGWATATMAATAAGLAVIFFGRGWLWRLAGGLLIVIPHVIGVQGRAHVEHGVPADLVAEFVVASLIITALFWMLLGGLAGYFSRRASAV